MLLIRSAKQTARQLFNWHIPSYATSFSRTFHTLLWFYFHFFSLWGLPSQRFYSSSLFSNFFFLVDHWACLYGRDRSGVVLFYFFLSTSFFFLVSIHPRASASRSRVCQRNDSNFLVLSRRTFTIDSPMGTEQPWQWQGQFQRTEIASPTSWPQRLPLLSVSSAPVRPVYRAPAYYSLRVPCSEASFIGSRPSLLFLLLWRYIRQYVPANTSRGSRGRSLLLSRMGLCSSLIYACTNTPRGVRPVLMAMLPLSFVCRPW